MADVSIDASVSTATARGQRSVVFPTADTGYWFYLDSDGTFGYSKSTDGGATWGGQVEIAAATTHTSYDVWFDKWTPSDTGTKIHTWYVDTTNDDITWRSLDTNGDTLASAVAVISLTSATAARGSFVSGTKTRSGYLYVCADIDAGAERGLYRSTDSGTSWSANLDANFLEATIDQCLLFPASNTGDNNDCWAVYQDASADALTLKMWDSSAASASESSTIVAMAENVTDLAPGSYGFSASVRHSDGHLIIASMSAYDASTTHSVWDVNGTGSITALTSIQSATDDHYYPAVFIDQNNNWIYVAYNGKRDGSETLATTTKVYYTKSTDNGTSWSAGDTAYMEGAAGVVVQIWAPLMGGRFYVGWRVGSTLLGNKVNSVLSQALLGTSTATFAPTGLVAGAGALAGSGTATFSPTATLLGEAVIAGTSTATFAPTAVMQAVVDMVGTLTISFVGSAAMTGAGALAGSGTTAFTPTAALVGAGDLLGSGTATFAPVAVLAGAGALAGSLAVTFTLGATADASGALAGTSAPAFTLTAAMNGAGALLGAGTATFTGTATMLGDAPLIGNLLLAFAPIGTLNGSGELAGQSASAFTASGTLDLPSGGVAGSVAIVFSNTGTLTGAGVLAGQSAPAFVLSGLLDGTGLGDMAALATLSFTTQGVLLADGALAGETLLAFLADATLHDATLPAVVPVVYGGLAGNRPGQQSQSRRSSWRAGAAGRPPNVSTAKRR